MAKHEARCTHNPSRVCGMCKIATDDDDAQKPMGDLIAALDVGGLPALRELAGECPACILAAIVFVRRRDRERTATKITESDGRSWLSYADNWPGKEYDYKAAVENMWAEHNNAEQQREYEREVAYYG